MLLSTIVFSFTLGLAASASGNSIRQKSSVIEHDIWTLNDSATISKPMTTRPWPNETIGEYFDKLLSTNETDLQRRRLQRSKALIGVVWSDGKTTFNISMSRCVSMSDVIGIYTAKTGVQYNSTIIDIMNDLQVRGGSATANQIRYASRVHENSQLAISAANAYLKTTALNFKPTYQNTHNELRHILAPMGEYVALIARAKLEYEIMLGLSMTMMSFTGNASMLGPITDAIVVSGLHLAQQCQSLSRQDPGLSFLQSTIMNTFLALLRDITDKARSLEAGDHPARGTNRTEDTLLGLAQWPRSRTALQSAMARLRDTSEHGLRFGSQVELEAGSSCVKT